MSRQHVIILGAAHHAPQGIIFVILFRKQPPAGAKKVQPAEARRISRAAAMGALPARPSYR